MPSSDPPAFRPLAGIYEPSAVQQLPDGRFLVVEDERRHPFSTFTIDAAGKAHSRALTPTLFQMFSAFWELEDLEGLALDASGFVYAITSHSRDDEGRRKKTREKLVRFRVDGNHVVDTAVVEGLMPALTACHPVLAKAAEVLDVKAGGGLNIEALAISPDPQKMLIGFRGPLRGGRALIASIDNFREMFDAGAKPAISPVLEELDLGGFGIRGLSHVPALGEYLIIGGPVSKADTACKLWRWKGPGATPRAVELAGLQGFAHAEGVSPATIAGAQRLIIVSDDGDRKSRRDASYLMLDVALLTAPSRREPDAE